jgi:O-antigen ligase
LNALASPSPKTPTFAARYQNALRRLGVAALVALALTPFIIDPQAHDDSFFTPKWAWMALWSALGVAAVAARALAGRVALFPLNEVWIGTLLFTLWHWVAVLWAPSKSLGLERATRVTWLALALWLGLQLNLRRRVLLKLAWVAVAWGTVTGLWVLYDDAMRAWFPQWVHVKSNLGDWRGYLTAGLGNTSHIGDLLGLALLPTLALFGEARTRLAKTLLFLAALVIPAGMIVSLSVGSDFGLIAGAALMAVLVVWRDRGRWFRRRQGRWLALAAAWAALIAFFVLPNPASPHPAGVFNEAFGSQRWKDGGPTRLAIWAQTLEMIRKHPVGGVGTGNFTYVFPEMDSRLVWDRPELRAYQGLWTNAAHNEILQTWAELGAGGLFLFLALVGLAFYTLLKGLAWTDNQSFLIRTTLAGLLLAWLVQAQMNFSLQHPAGALTFYALLLAAALEKRTRPGLPSFPSLSMESGPLILRLDGQTMTKPTAIGVALSLPRPLGVGLGVALLLAVAGWMAVAASRPVRAQREYKRAVALEQADPAAADAHFKKALAVCPTAQDVRSHYSDWLIRRGRAQEGLDQLAVVRRRLNSNELWEREYRGLKALGRGADAQRALDTYVKRLWQVRVMMSQAAGGR